MACICNRPNGRRFIQFFDTEGIRRTIYLGKMSVRNAEAVKVKIEDLVSSAFTGHPPSRETQTWLRSISDALREKLARVGLVKPLHASTLGAFLDRYIEQRADVKPSTRSVYERVRGFLVDYFGKDKALREITPGEADAWRLHLLAEGYADNTVRRSCGIAKQFMKAAVREKLLDENPFADLVAIVRGNPSRYHFISRDVAEKVLKACPDAEWRLIFALARYGGLRVPSELLPLKWSDIDWDRKRITITSPKTEHLEGKASREIPIFPELQPYLIEARKQARPDAVYCIERHRGSNVNLRTQLLKILTSAGVERWPKLFQNLRSTRQTELADKFPAHVVGSWIGNSQPVAAKHYLQTTDEHFNLASGRRPTTDAPATPQHHARGGSPLPALQGALHQRHPNRANKRHRGTSMSPGGQKNADCDEEAPPGTGQGVRKMGDTGLEPVTSRV